MKPVGARPDGRQTLRAATTLRLSMFAEFEPGLSLIARQDGLLQVFHYNNHSFITVSAKCTSSVA